MDSTIMPSDLSENLNNSTLLPPQFQDNQVLGYAALMSACVCFGLSFLPLKFSNCGDGK
jgi:hypothetical protein